MENSQDTTNELSQSEQLEQVSNLLSGAPTHEEDDMEPTEAEEIEQPEDEEAESAGEEEAVGEEQGEEETLEAESLAELAEQFGVPVEKLYDLKIPMPYGHDPVTLGQFKDRVQELQRLDETREQVKQQSYRAQQMERELQEVLSQAQGAPEEVQSAQAELANLQQQAQQVDWDKFERRDPGKAALAKTKLYEAMGQANARLQAAQQRAQQAAMAVRQRRLAEGQRAVLEHVQEWRDPEVAKRDIQEIATVFSSSYGFDPQELMMVDDPRVVMVMREHAKLLKRMGEADVAAKQVRKAPRHLKPVKSRRQSANVKRQQQLNERAKKLGTIDAQTAAVSNLLSSRGIS